MSDQKDILLLKVAQYFVSKHQYKFVDIKQSKKEIWLGTSKNEDFPVIRLSMTSMTDNDFDKQRLLQLNKSICEFFKVDAKLLDIHLTSEVIDMDDDIQHVSLSDTHMSGVDLSIAFPDLDVSIMRIDTEENNKKQQLPFGLSRFGGGVVPLNQLPYVTYGVAIVCFIVFLLTSYISGTLHAEATTSAIVVGAYYKAFIVAGQEYFRFLTAGFVHYELLHFMMNMIALMSLGQICEKIYKRSQFIIILLGSIIFGSIFIFAAQGNVLTVGLSGGLYGLMAALLVYGFDSRVIYNPAVAKSFISTLILNLIITFMPGISLFGHIGGFVGGLFLAIFFTKNKTWKLFKQNALISFAILVVILGYKAAENFDIKPIYYGTDKAVLDFMETNGFSGYSSSMEKKLESFYGFEIR